ncbi:hypothetical protein AB0E25_19500 [Streptomyces bobili]
MGSAGSLAMYVQVLHTNVPTRLPLPLHLANLAARYIQRRTERGR